MTIFTFWFWSYKFKYFSVHIFLGSFKAGGISLKHIIKSVLHTFFCCLRLRSDLSKLPSMSKKRKPKMILMCFCELFDRNIGIFNALLYQFCWYYIFIPSKYYKCICEQETRMKELWLWQKNIKMRQVKQICKARKKML